jgi:translocation and assembly module TamA
MQVSGMERYDPVLVPRSRACRPASIYDQEKIVQAQLRLVRQRLLRLGLHLRRPRRRPDAAPVQVNVREAPLQKVVLGVGFTTDGGPRGSSSTRTTACPASAGAPSPSCRRNASRPSSRPSWSAVPGRGRLALVACWGASSGWTTTLVTNGQRLRVGRFKSGEHIDRNVYLQYERATCRTAATWRPRREDTGDGSALSANYIWTGRYFDASRTPPPASASGRGRRRRHADRRPQPVPAHGAALAGNPAAGRAAAAVRVPKAAPCWPRSGRACRPRSCSAPAATPRCAATACARSAPLRVNDVVVPGRYLAVGSIEYQHPIRRNGVDTPLEGVVFVDAGAVANRAQDLRPSVGVGSGVRFRSPLGPLQVDLAYGVQVHRFRLHINLGTAFW